VVHSARYFDHGKARARGWLVTSVIWNRESMQRRPRNGIRSRIIPELPGVFVLRSVDEFGARDEMLGVSQGISLWVLLAAASRKSRMGFSVAVAWDWVTARVRPRGC
jgi:hypothetical protein